MNQVLEFLTENKDLITFIAQWTSIIMLQIQIVNLDRYIHKRLSGHLGIIAQKSILDVLHNKEIENLKDEVKELRDRIDELDDYIATH